MKIGREDVIAAIKAAKVIPNIETLRDDVKLSDQGVDSLGIFDVIFRIQETFGIEIPDSDLDHLTTIPSIVTYLREKKS